MKSIAVLLLCSFCFLLNAQEISSDQKTWHASWITVPATDPTGYGVYLFRKNINLSSKPATFIVKISADNRYKLFVNEQLASHGPARGDLNNWNYETVDLAPFLKTGQNIIAAQVWNEGEHRAEGQIPLMTAFILQAVSTDQSELNTDNTWKCIRDSSYRPVPVRLQAYYVSGPGEEINMTHHIKGWRMQSYNDAHWKQASPLYPGTPKDMSGPFGIANGWMLTPSIIPQMELTTERFRSVRKSSGIALPQSFPAQKPTVSIPANTTTTLLLDQGYLINAYPTLLFSGGKAASITLTYAEALYTNYPEKGNRNDIEGKQIIGRKDIIISDGSPQQQFTPLTWRTYRYVEVNVVTKEDAMTIEDVYGTFTGYPFKLNAKLETQNDLLQQIFNIGWRTARLCAVETYMDCPYYEQLQYIGDTRIQGLISIYNSGDERLLKNAINLIDHSRHADGLTESRHPSVHAQYIPTFSLWYVGMLHDYMMYGSDMNFLKGKLNGARQVLQYFNRYQQADGSLKNVPWWMFTDWVTDKDWHEGIAPIGKDGYSAPMDLQLLWAYQLAADLERKFGEDYRANEYDKQQKLLSATIRKKYWNAAKGLYADRTEKDLYSQHTNTLAILTGVADNAQISSIAKQLLADSTLAPASIYFKYYLHRALVKAGLGDQYISWLDKWKENIDMGLTTWAEMSDVNTSRSDCHAWGSSPNIEFFRTVLGIDSDAPFFTKIRIEPRPGDLENVAGEIPHYRGKINVRLTGINKNGTAAISLPQGISGTFVWKGKEHVLKAGNNQVRL